MPRLLQGCYNLVFFIWACVRLFDQLNTDTPLLKGVDRIVYLVAKSLGLSVMVKLIYGSGWEGEKYLISKFSKFNFEGNTLSITTKYSGDLRLWEGPP